MQKFKKALAVFLAGVMALVMLTACGGTDGGNVQHITGAFEAADHKDVTIAEMQIASCSVQSFSADDSTDGTYKGYEMVAVTLAIRNYNKAPLDMEVSYSTWAKLMFGSGMTYDERMTEWLSQNSKYMTAKADGKAVAARSAGFIPGDTEASVMPSGGYGTVQLHLMAPAGWKSLEVTYTPSNANGASVVFHLTRADVKN